MGLFLVEDLQYWSRRQGFLQGFKCSFFLSFPLEFNSLLCQVSQGLGDGGKSFDEPPIEVREPQEPLYLTHTRRSWP